MITNEIEAPPVPEKDKLDCDLNKEAPIVNGTNVDTLPKSGKEGDPATQFLRAARAGKHDKVLEFLDSGGDINSCNLNGLNALHLAAKDGHTGIAIELLNRGALVDAATKKGNTALHIASLAGRIRIVEILIERGAQVNVQSQNGFTPLYMAAQENHDEVVKILLNKGASQTLATEDGFTPLAVAMQQGHDKVVTVLLENDTRGKVRLPALHIASKKNDCKVATLLLQNHHDPDVTSKSGFTPLHIAAHYGNAAVAKLLHSKGADVNFTAKHNITPLHVASKWGKYSMVAMLIDAGAKLDAVTRDGLTPLHCAARSGHEEVVNKLVEKGAPIRSKTKNGLAPLHMASQGDHVDAARILLYHNAPVDEVTVDYLTALHVAAHCGHVLVAKLLLDRKADPDSRALNGFTPLHIACKKNRLKVVELLLKYGASIEATTESGLTPLHVASFMGCMNIVIFLLQHNAQPDVPTVRGETPLHLAARANQTDIIRILLRNNAQVDVRAREDQTPLHVASRLGNADIVMLLLQHGATVDAATKDLYTPLHIAAKEGQEEVAIALLDQGASPNTTTKKGFTPLHLAAKYGNKNVAKLLLAREAVVDAQGKNGVTPLHVASHYCHQQIACLLLEHKASPHAAARNGHTPLHIAARKNLLDVAVALLEHGGRADAESRAGFTPLHLAAQEGHTEMVQLLLEHSAVPDHQAKNGLVPLHLCAQEDKVDVAKILVESGAKVDTATKAGFTPLHVAAHYGQLNMARYLIDNNANVNTSNAIGYTPLHQAAQQGHVIIINLLLESKASPDATTNTGQTALSIAQKLGYISVVETLKIVTETTITTTTTTTIEEKYKVVAPEAMHETYMSDSEDEGGADEDMFGRPAHAQHVYLPYYQGEMKYTREDPLVDHNQYSYMTADDMKLGDDSHRIDVTRDEENRAPSRMNESIIGQDNYSENWASPRSGHVDNINVKRAVHHGFLVSFLVDARGGAMRGCRHSGVRVIVPPRKAPAPMRITCRYLKKDKLPHPPPLMEGEALASRVLELGPVGAKFLGPVIIEVPHFASLRNKEREIVICRSDNGETWREHTLEASHEAVQDVLNESFDGDELTQIEDLNTNRITRILTEDFPQYFAIITRLRQEVHGIGPDGGTVSSSVVPQVQAVFPPNALTKKIRVGLQAHPIPTELVAKLLGNRVAISPIVTVEPRRRKFHKPITLTIPIPQAASKGMINQYSGEAPTLRLLCSITGGSTRAQWEDVTGSTPLTFVKDCVSFTTTVSARFWLMDCRNISDATKMATELYREAVHVPFMAKFVVFAKRVDPLEARLRVFCMTDDREEKTLEHQENFTEVSKSRDVEVLEGKVNFVELAGNMVPITKSGDQLHFVFKAFKENRLPFNVRVRDQHEEAVARIYFMKDPKVARGDPSQPPICTLNLSLPENILPDGSSEQDLLDLDRSSLSYIQDTSVVRETIHRADIRLSDIANRLHGDWVPLARELNITDEEIADIERECPNNVPQQANIMLKLWVHNNDSNVSGNLLEKGLRAINREDIVTACIFNVEPVRDDNEKAMAEQHLDGGAYDQSAYDSLRMDQSGLESLQDELSISRDHSLRREQGLEPSYAEKDILKESESVEDLKIEEKINRDHKEQEKVENETIPSDDNKVDGNWKSIYPPNKNCWVPVHLQNKTNLVESELDVETSKQSETNEGFRDTKRNCSNEIGVGNVLALRGNEEENVLESASKTSKNSVDDEKSTTTSPDFWRNHPPPDDKYVMRCSFPGWPIDHSKKKDTIISYDENVIDLSRVPNVFATNADTNAAFIFGINDHSGQIRMDIEAAPQYTEEIKDVDSKIDPSFSNVTTKDDLTQNNEPQINSTLINIIRTHKSAEVNTAIEDNVTDIPDSLIKLKNLKRAKDLSPEVVVSAVIRCEPQLEKIENLCNVLPTAETMKKTIESVDIPLASVEVPTDVDLDLKPGLEAATTVVKEPAIDETVGIQSLEKVVDTSLNVIAKEASWEPNLSAIECIITELPALEHDKCTNEKNVVDIPIAAKRSISVTRPKPLLGDATSSPNKFKLLQPKSPSSVDAPIVDLPEIGGPKIPVRPLNLALSTSSFKVPSTPKLGQTTKSRSLAGEDFQTFVREKLTSPLRSPSENVYQSVYGNRLRRGYTVDLPTVPKPNETPIMDISGHLEITHPSGVTSTPESKPVPLPRSPDNVNFDLEVARKLTQPDDVGTLNLPEISDASKRITKSKSKKKGKSKIPQRQDSKESKSSSKEGASGVEREVVAEDVVWDFDDRKEDAFLKEERLRNAGYDTANGKCRESGDSGSESDSRGSPRRHQVLNSPGKRTIASSSGSDVALHEGAELSPDDNTDVVGADGLRQSMQNILDQFMNEERRFDNQ